MKIECDGKIFYPLGGGSYVFEKDFLKYILSKVKKNKVKISIGAQPNSSPHIGTLCVFSLAFSLAEKIHQNSPKIETSILFEVVDTAPSETVTIDDIMYQRNLEKSGVANKYMPEFIEILEYFGKKNNIKYEIRYHREFNSNPRIKELVSKVIENKNDIAKFLDPKYNNLRIRVSCPKCGLAEKNCTKTKITKKSITCFCPEHGKYTVDISKDTSSLEYNTPLRNLIRAMLYGDINNSKDYDYEIIRVTGSDYAGFYQEELLYKIAALLEYPVINLPMIVYCPLILDWSGAKISKSLYVREGAYGDIPIYLLNYEELIRNKGLEGLDTIYDITNEWMDNPYMLFRHYTIYYFIKKFEEKVN